MSFGLVLFLTGIVIAAVVGACRLMICLERNFPSEKYDERQKIARGNAYRFSHWIGMIYYIGLMAYFVFHTGKSEWMLQPFCLVAIGILLQLLGFHIYCLMTHSALPLGEKPVPTILYYCFMGSVYLALYFFQHVPEDTVGLTGEMSFNLFRLLISLSFFSLAVLHLIAHLRKEKE